MQRIRIVGLSIVYMLAVSALAAASAAAAPPEVHGNSEGPLASKGLTLQTVGGEKMVCKSTSGSGAGATEPATVEVFLALQGCAAKKAPCGEAAFSLTGTLGYINKAKKEVGADFPLTLNFECGGMPVVVIGSVIAKISPVNKPVTALKIKLAQTKGVQKIKNFEASPADFPMAAFVPEPLMESGIALNATVSLGVPVVITA